MQKPKKLIIEGFPHMRDYARGYIRTSGGPGWVTVGGLDSGETYEFEISQYCSDHCPLRPGPKINSKLFDSSIFSQISKVLTHQNLMIRLLT